MKLKSKSNKFQDVHFDSIDELLDYLPANELAMVKALRHLIMECIPRCSEKLSYNVPFYGRNAGICFIWPGAIPWGKKQTDGVRLGFNKGYLLNDEDGYLDKGTRKQVYCKDYKSISDIEHDKDMIRTFLFEAASIDEELNKTKKRKTSTF